jgi:hypothetical protein
MICSGIMKSQSLRIGECIRLEQPRISLSLVFLSDTIVLELELLAFQHQNESLKSRTFGLDLR